MPSIIFDDLNDQEFNEAMEALNREDIDIKAESVFTTSLDELVNSSNKLITEESEYLLMEEALKRSQLPDKSFGVPDQRKFPLTDEAHVRSAIKFFNYVDSEHEAQLASRIKRKMKQYGINDVNVSDKNRFSKYYKPKKAVNEGNDIYYENVSAKGYDNKSGWLGQDKEGKWLLFPTEQEYIEYLADKEVRESNDHYLNRQESILSEIGEFLESDNTLNIISGGNEESIKEFTKICPICKSPMGIFIEHNIYCRCTNEDCTYIDGEVITDRYITEEEDDGIIQPTTQDRVHMGLVDKVVGPDALSKDKVVAALEKAATINKPAERSKELRNIMSKTIGKLSAKVKFIIGNMRLYKKEYEYTGYIKEIFPKYIDMLDPKDLYKLKESIMEHAFTTGRGHKSLSDTINSVNGSDRDNYVYNIATILRKDLSNILHYIDKKYESARFGDNVKKFEPPKEKSEEKKVEDEDNPIAEKPKKRKSYWDVDVSEEDEKEAEND